MHTCETCQVPVLVAVVAIPPVRHRFQGLQTPFQRSLHDIRVAVWLQGPLCFRRKSLHSMVCIFAAGQGMLRPPRNIAPEQRQLSQACPTLSR